MKRCYFQVEFVLNGEQVLVRVHAAGVNPVDTYIRTGTYARLPTLPYTPGLDSAGVIEQVGAEVTKFKVNTIKTIFQYFRRFQIIESQQGVSR